MRKEIVKVIDSFFPGQQSCSIKEEIIQVLIYILAQFLDKIEGSERKSQIMKSSLYLLGASCHALENKITLAEVLAESFGNKMH